MDGAEDSTRHPQLSQAPDKGMLAVALIGAFWVVAAAVLIPPAGFTIDDFIYHAMIDAFARNGSLFVENGYAEHGVDALRLRLLRDMNGQLAPQYPGGWGIIASPAYMLGGLRGVITLNAIASALTLLFVWQAAWLLFQDRKLATRAALILAIATFVVDYAFAIWPHGFGTMLVAAAIASVAKGARGAPEAEARWTFLAGVLLGIGINIRVDVVFAAAPLSIWLLGTSRRPYLVTTSLLAGLIPGLAAATLVNWIKFGALSPATYGVSSGGTSLNHYARFIPIVAAGALATLTLGSSKVRALVYQPKILALITAAGIAISLTVPMLRQLLISVLQGFWVLMFEFQHLPPPSHGLTELPDGTIRMWGLVKKALLQSLPYAAAMIILAPRLMRGPDRAALALCVLFIIVAALPFAVGSWHGGMSNNMRYFLNMLPVLAILSAAAIGDIKAMMDGKVMTGIIAAAAVIIFGALFPLSAGAAPDFVVQNTLPNAIIAAIIVLALTALIARGAIKAVSARALYGLTLAGLLTAAISAWGFDLAVNIGHRHLHHTMATRTADIPANALVVSQAQIRSAMRLNRPPALSAYSDNEHIEPSLAGLIDLSFKQGKPVFAQGRELADLMVAQNVAASYEPRYDIDEILEIFEMKPPAAAD